MFRKIGQALRRFMAGRYGGADQLNMTVLVICLILSVAGSLCRLPWLTLLAYIPTGWALFRCFSKNPYKRYEENRRFMQFWDRLKDRQHRYYKCPKCRQQVRVPRGKGKISITCPKCQEKFIKKT